MNYDTNKFYNCYSCGNDYSISEIAIADGITCIYCLAKAQAQNKPTKKEILNQMRKNFNQ